MTRFPFLFVFVAYKAIRTKTWILDFFCGAAFLVCVTDGSMFEGFRGFGYCHRNPINFPPETKSCDAKLRHLLLTLLCAASRCGAIEIELWTGTCLIDPRVGFLLVSVGKNNGLPVDCD